MDLRGYPWKTQAVGGTRKIVFLSSSVFENQTGGDSSCQKPANSTQNKLQAK